MPSGAAGNGMGTTIDYLRGDASIGLGTIKYLQRTTSGVAGSDRAQRSSNCGAQRAASRATD
jgi:hypothetical protein